MITLSDDKCPSDTVKRPHEYWIDLLYGDN